ncbi:MAG TPA: L,D-transpeptidase family protein [Ktedonobacteraceae bacterium]|nr:L,D-transpeptidase family protein [Ktedonobacteraceae bacterium]
MRRSIMLLLLFVLLVLVTACGQAPSGTTGSRGETPSPVSTPSETRTPDATPSPVKPPLAAAVPVKPGVPSAPSPAGKAILVSLSQQWLYAYEDGKLVFDHAVETGRPELPTPAGTFSVIEKMRNVMFTSPWEEGSPFYYEPTHVNHALLFKEGGFFLHDAPWHEQFGPGSNEPHQLPDGRWETGSHGCVGMPLADAERLYAWASVGTPIMIRR